MCAAAAAAALLCVRNFCSTQHLHRVRAAVIYGKVHWLPFYLQNWSRKRIDKKKNSYIIQIHDYQFSFFFSF